MKLSRFVPVILAGILAACGGAAGQPGPNPGSSAPSGQVSASSGNLTVTAHPASSVRAGDSVIVDLDVTGPADYQAACVQTLHIWALDASGQQVWEEPVPPVMCMAIANKHVPAGAVDHFEAAWPVASTVAPGTYSIHGLFLYTLPPGAGMRVRENLPVVTVQIGG